MTATVITHPASLAEAKREVDAATRKYTGLQDGFLLWQQEYPEITCTDPQQWAVEQAFAELEDAREVLAALQEQAPTGSER